MDNIVWSSYGKYDGPLFKGTQAYNPIKPHTTWQKILGVIADCEGKFDTVVMHDGTGITAGFMQWTLTSGRLQKFFEFTKTLTYPGKFPGTTGYKTIHEVVLQDINGIGIFIPYGFDFINGKMIGLSDGKILDPAKDKDKIVMVCRGRTNKHAEDVLTTTVEAMYGWGVAEAQMLFAEEELKASLAPNRSILGSYKNINQLLFGTWDTPAPALFFNLYQNNPKAAFSLFIRARNDKTQDLFESAWSLLKQSTFGNWSYNSNDYKKYKRKPRIERIKASIDRYYGTNMAI